MANIMILNGAARKNGRTASLIKAFTDGAESVGNTVSEFYLQEMNINGCMGCDGCSKAPKDVENPCVQKDDMAEINDVIRLKLSLDPATVADITVFFSWEVRYG